MTGQSFTPSTDPAFQSYLRSSGVKESDIMGTAQHRIDTLNRADMRAQPEYDAQQERALDDVRQDFQSRGLFRSGRRLFEQARDTSDIERARLDQLARTQDQITDIELQSILDQAGIARERGEESIAQLADPNRWLPA